MVDPIADMITRIRNAGKAGHKTVVIPLSKLKVEIAKILKEENYIEDFSAKGGAASGGKKSGKGIDKFLEIVLKQPSAISEIKKISRLGQRIYAGATGIKKVKSGYGIAIVSTPKGLMTGKEARKQHLGGEVLLEVW